MINLENKYLPLIKFKTTATPRKVRKPMIPIKVGVRVSSKDIQKARQIAKRNRASVACSRCKAAKIRCSDYRPCKQCTASNAAQSCLEGSPTMLNHHTGSSQFSDGLVFYASLVTRSGQTNTGVFNNAPSQNFSISTSSAEASTVRPRILHQPSPSIGFGPPSYPDQPFHPSWPAHHFHNTAHAEPVPWIPFAPAHIPIDIRRLLIAQALLSSRIGLSPLGQALLPLPLSFTSPLQLSSTYPLSSTSPLHPSSSSGIPPAVAALLGLGAAASRLPPALTPPMPPPRTCH